MSQALDRLGELANADTWLIHRGRFLDVTFLVEEGETSIPHPHPPRACRGRRKRGRSSSRDGRSRLRASAEAWATFWKAIPPPGHHDLIAMLKMRALRIEGDQQPFMANLRYFKDLLALPRERTGARA